LCNSNLGESEEGREIVTVEESMFEDIQALDGTDTESEPTSKYRTT